MPLLSIIGPWSGSLGVPSNSAHNGLGDWECLLKIVGEENYPPVVAGTCCWDGKKVSQASE